MALRLATKRKAPITVTRALPFTAFAILRSALPHALGLDALGSPVAAAELVFVDPITYLAVLDEPDGQELFARG
jgi:hypothetical protein